MFSAFFDSHVQFDLEPKKDWFSGFWSKAIKTVKIIKVEITFIRDFFMYILCEINYSIEYTYNIEKHYTLLYENIKIMQERRI